MGKPASLLSLRGWPGRILLAACGFGMIAYLVHGAGPARVAHVMWQAGPWLPLIAGLELCEMGTDILAIYLLLGEGARKVPLSTWVRSSTVAYAMMTLLPAGRAAGEVARAALLAKEVGTSAAANASVRLSGAYLSGNALASAAAFVTVAAWVGFRVPLTLLLGANVLLVAVSAGGLFAVARDARLGRLIERLRRRFAPKSEPLAPLPEGARAFPWRAAAACWIGRTAQLTQYGVILGAVGGRTSFRGAFVAQGIHLVGATLGDLLPNQLGVVDGVYRTFAPVLGFAEAPERALSIAFVIHAVQLSVAGVCVLVAALTRREGPREGAPSTMGADARS